MEYLIAVLAFACLFTFTQGVGEQCSGKAIATLASDADVENLAHINGDVYYRADTKCFELCKFNYDYGAPDMYFWCDNSLTFTQDSGFKMSSKDTKDNKFEKISQYTNADVTVCFPDGKTIRDCKAFGLFCYSFSKTFSSVEIKVDTE